MKRVINFVHTGTAHPGENLQTEGEGMPGAAAGYDPAAGNGRHFDEDGAYIRGDVFSEGREQSIEVYLSRNSRRRLLANGVRLRTAADLSGRLTAVLFCRATLI